MAYAQYQNFAAAKCFRLGVELLTVNPAYSSVISRIKYAVPYGRSVHLAAVARGSNLVGDAVEVAQLRRSGVIARRGQGLSERFPRAKSVRIEAHGAISPFLLPARKGKKRNADGWAGVHRSLTDFLRKSYLATLETRKGRGTSTRSKWPPAAKPNGAKGGSSAGVRAGSPSSGTAPLRAVKLTDIFDEQI